MILITSIKSIKYTIKIWWSKWLKAYQELSAIFQHLIKVYCEMEIKTMIFLTTCFFYYEYYNNAFPWITYAPRTTRRTTFPTTTPFTTTTPSTTSEHDHFPSRLSLNYFHFQLLILFHQLILEYSNTKIKIKI